MKFWWGFRPVGIPSSGDSVQWGFRVVISVGCCSTTGSIVYYTSSKPNFLTRTISLQDLCPRIQGDIEYRQTGVDLFEGIWNYDICPRIQGDIVKQGRGRSFRGGLQLCDLVFVHVLKYCTVIFNIVILVYCITIR